MTLFRKTGIQCLLQTHITIQTCYWAWLIRLVDIRKKHLKSKTISLRSLWAATQNWVGELGLLCCARLRAWLQRKSADSFGLARLCSLQSLHASEIARPQMPHAWVNPAVFPCWCDHMWYTSRQNKKKLLLGSRRYKFRQLTNLGTT